MTLAEKYSQEIQAIFAKYPPEHKRSAVMPLLYLAQREEGYVSQQAMQEIADLLEISVTEVAGLVGFYTLYHGRKEGKHRIQVCTDLPCALRGADEFLKELSQALGIQPGETTPDGRFTLEEVMCLGACHRAPVFQVQSGDELTYYENMDLQAALHALQKLE
uniref:NADH dehydrogenase (Ubiquinone) flavoprotein 2 n=1 Tax=uncultured Chloroflexota bacterium TaxID=166587 RepID=H5S8R6_9CHLR|nr:NADH dehydrogenase (ubiquinone) flavoprotein 2 [uncultured Chloroflexota bacterium]BAL56861.1 NADH dehydrogenase (ubiquinone) flavoprotein 2 [uncultured Chloroflexota bacterium]